MRSRLRVVRFPVTDYATAWRWQVETAAAVRDGAPDTLALLQHSPVYTFGRRVRPEHLLVARESVEVVETTRGGDITFHGPGQLVGYPILNLRRRQLGALDYVCGLEETLIRTLDRFGIAAHRVSGLPGVWTDAGKIAAIGVRVEGGVSLHGFALNVEPDLSYFEAIIPCGLADAGVTSMQRVLVQSPGLDAVATALEDEFRAVFNYTADTVGKQRQEMEALT